MAVTEERDVVIIGAGIAGLTAARELRAHDPLVFEASDRVGGRIWSKQCGELAMSVGAHMFPPPDSVIGGLVTEYGLDVLKITGSMLNLALQDRVIQDARPELMPFKLPLSLRGRVSFARAGLKALCLDKLAPGGEIINLGALHDFEEMFDGTTMAARLTDDAAVAGVEIGFGEVSAIAGTGPFEVETTDGERHSARSVVVATGLNKGKLGIPGEDEYEGRGLSHCANCDGPLYAGQPVIVAGATGWAPYEAAVLVGIAGDITMLGTPTGPVPEGVTAQPGRIVALEGSNGLEAVTIENDGQRNRVSTNAVFVYEGRSPAAEFVPDSLARDATGHIVVDAQGQTGQPLVFAAGDVRSDSKEYLADAIADGQRVAKTVVAALNK